jgi:hypothetical protein
MEVEMDWTGKMPYPYFTQGYLISCQRPKFNVDGGIMFGIDTHH